MKITSKGQVTIPLAVREKAGLHPHGEVEFEVRDNGDVVIRPVLPASSGIRAAFAKARGSANATAFKGMSTDEFMVFLRG
ncbi:AbrB/MazE/SpoVT family DNA-binding domain-containing protein [Dechloromonas sp. ARDL1]|uniref:AbrB/MazE/SpoVT family DNA-binding domain-containing protein n=1 Tax=Dechloromonas sp. ARDL1 TaxID=3322121 RepID=UPI003DA7383D